MLFELIAHLLLQRGARVKHHAQQADDLQVRIHIGMHLLDGVHQIGQPLQRKIFALHGHDHAMRRAQPVQRQHGQAGRAVNQHKIKITIGLRQSRFQALGAPLQGNQLNLGTAELPVGPQHRKPAWFRAHRRLGHAGRFEQHVVHAQGQRPLVHAGTHGGVALRIQINQQNPLANFGQACGQIHRRGGFTDSALLVGNTKNLGHATSLTECQKWRLV